MSDVVAIAHIFFEYILHLIMMYHRQKHGMRMIII